jgi:hypothetical protein
VRYMPGVLPQVVLRVTPGWLQHALQHQEQQQGSAAAL